MSLQSQSGKLKLLRKTALHNVECEILHHEVHSEPAQGHVTFPLGFVHHGPGTLAELAMADPVLAESAGFVWMGVFVSRGPVELLRGAKLASAPSLRLRCAVALNYGCAGEPLRSNPHHAAAWRGPLLA